MKRKNAIILLSLIAYYFAFLKLFEEALLLHRVPQSFTESHRGFSLCANFITLSKNAYSSSK